MPLLAAYMKKHPEYDPLPAQKIYYEFKIDKAIASGMQV